MKAAATLPLLLLFAVPSFAADRTLWLVRPLYPGQEALAGKTEQSLDKLTPAALRANHVIGKAELVTALKGKKVEELPCFMGETRCADPIDPFIATLGFDRVVLIQGGQDETGFKFKVVSYEPASGKVSSASASEANLDNALLGAVAKVVPVTASLEVTSTPSGATVFVDDRKVGTTPVSAQVLPGERVVRIDLKLHQAIEEPVIVPMKGSVKLEKNLEKVAARIIITAQPPGTSITVDGQVLGKDKVDRGIQPGAHTIRLTAENYKAFEQTIQVKADDQLILDKSLEPIPGTAAANPPPGRDVVIIKQPPADAQPPPAPLSITEQYQERKSYFYIGFEYDNLSGGGFTAHRFGDSGFARAAYIDSTNNRRLIGGSFEFGYFGKYFGLAAVGFTIELNDTSWTMSMGRSVNPPTGTAAHCATGEDDDDTLECRPTTIHAKVVLANIRLIQPAFRVQVWRFMFSLQVGFELRIGHLTQSDTPVKYNDGFMVFDIGLSGRLGMRFYIVDGLFVYGHYRVGGIFASALDSGGVIDAITGNTVKTAALNHGFSGGFGYAF